MSLEPVESDVLGALREPLLLARLPADRLTDLFVRARNSGLLGRIAARAAQHGATDALPKRVQGVLEAALTAADAFQRMPRFETDRIRRALSSLEHDIILLKGSAYVMCGLPVAAGRTLSDVDILLPHDLCAKAETLLLGAGWKHVKMDDYDQRYFRQWMHELPPLRHSERRTIIDLHHTILPVTGRLRPDPRLLISASIPVPGMARLRVLAPADMVLHNIVHHFQDGEFQHSLRELVDLDDLLRHFSSLPKFWDDFVERVELLGFGRPAFYALRYVNRLLGTEVPDRVNASLQRHAPPSPVLALMDAAIPRCLVSSGRRVRGLPERLAAKSLYLRAQWLKLPPHLLARHAWSKATRRWRRAPSREEPTNPAAIPPRV